MANDLLRSDSMNADAMYVRGLCLYYEDFVDKAFTHFQQVLRLAPDHQRYEMKLYAILKDTVPAPWLTAVITIFSIICMSAFL